MWRHTATITTNYNKNRRRGYRANECSVSAAAAARVDGPRRQINDKMNAVYSDARHHHANYNGFFVDVAFRTRTVLQGLRQALAADDTAMAMSLQLHAGAISNSTARRGTQ